MFHGEAWEVMKNTWKDNEERCKKRENKTAAAVCLWLGTIMKQKVQFYTLLPARLLLFDPNWPLPKAIQATSLGQKGQITALEVLQLMHLPDCMSA